MLSTKKNFSSIDEYIKNFPDDVQPKLEKVRQTIKKTVPEAVETISYNMPTFKLNGKYLIYFAANKNHIGIYPLPSGTDAFNKEIQPYKAAKSTIRFPLEKPVPLGLLKKIVKFLMAENQAREKKRNRSM